MEFFYDEQAVANNETSTQHHDDKTEEAFSKLEDEVNQGYEKTTQALKSIVRESDGGVKLNIPLDPEVSEKAQQYLQQLDANLHNVETIAQNYWTQVSKPGFWSSMTEKLGDRLDKVVKIGNSKLAEEAEETSKGAHNVVGGNRTEAELKSLSNDKNVYLNFDAELDQNFDVDAKTDEIARIIEKDKDLANLMNAVVPQDIPYKDFWTIFFVERQRILDMEDKRRKLLESSSSLKEEEISWDDVEEDEEDEEEPVIVKEEDALSKDATPIKQETVLSEKAKERGETANVSVQENEDDEEDVDDDDDWE